MILLHNLDSAPNVRTITLLASPNLAYEHIIFKQSNFLNEKIIFTKKCEDCLNCHTISGDQNSIDIQC